MKKPTFLTTLSTYGWSSSVRYAPTPRLSFMSFVSALNASETPRIGSGGAIVTPSKRETLAATAMVIRPEDCQNVNKRYDLSSENKAS